ncbi:MAG: hypothetical protein ACKOX2_12180, partial [Microcystaceae cyanobacterium]
ISWYDPRGTGTGGSRPQNQFGLLEIKSFQGNRAKAKTEPYLLSHLPERVKIAILFDFLTPQ